MREKDIYIAESVSEGHPDKVCDQVADAILDEALRQDKNSRVACEVFATYKKLIIGGEITTNAKIDYKSIALGVIKEIGYNKEFGIDPDNYEVEIIINSQSNEISNLVDNQDSLGAGDQGIVVGYATDQTDSYMPLHYVIATEIVKYASSLRKSGKLDICGPDMKSQISIDMSDSNNPKVVSILVSTQHRSKYTLEEVRKDFKEKVIDKIISKYNLNDDYDLLINPSGTFIKGGPATDAGLTGRKLMIDTYGVSANHGGGAFSGKDYTKVDRSAAYMARHIAKAIVSKKIAKEAEVFLSYVIGQSKPFAINVWLTDNEKDRSLVIEWIYKNFDLTPAGIIDYLDLKKPIYKQTSTYGHFGRKDLDLPWEKKANTDDTIYN